MAEKGNPLHATLLILLSAGLLSTATLGGLRLGHPLAGGLVGYALYLLLAARGIRILAPGADEVMRGDEIPPGSLGPRGGVT